MRKHSLTLLVVLLAIALGLGAVACGSGGETASGLTPEEAIKAAVETAQTGASQSGTYEIAVTIDADSGESDPMMQAFLGQPIVIKGDFAQQMDPVRADMTMGLNLMGMGIDLGMRAVDDQAWLNMMGQWYVIPAEQLDLLDTGDTAQLSASMLQMLSDKGIDPNSWYKDVKVVGEETLGDTKVTHMSATPDLQKMFADVFTLMQDPQFMGAVGDMAETDVPLEMPDASELQEAQDMVEQMFDNATIDLWLADSDNSLRKMVANLNMTMPQEAADMGIGGANIVATVNLNAPGTAVDVAAPASAKPLEQLEQDLANNPLLSGLGGMLGGGSGLGGGILGQ